MLKVPLNSGRPTIVENTLQPAYYWYCLTVDSCDWTFCAFCYAFVSAIALMCHNSDNKPVGRLGCCC